MPCFHPRDLVIKKEKIIYQWKQLPNGKMKRGEPISACRCYTIQVPCGKCPACLALQQSQWSFRIEQEALYGGHVSTLFVTLTYDNEHLPSDYCLHKSEVQKYLHDLRQRIDRDCAGTPKESWPKVRYYICGEYGSKRGRPHFHAILFFSRPIDWLHIQKAWNKGIVDIRPFTPARAGYVAKYSVKQLEFDYEGRSRPFHMQSQGLGKCFLNGRSIESLKYNMYFSNSSGRKIKLPRYYLDRLAPKRYYQTTDIFGYVHRHLSFNGVPLNYQMAVAASEVRFLENMAVERSLYGKRVVPFERFLIRRELKLEHELKKLQLKSSYYVQTAYESRLSAQSVS